MFAITFKEICQVSGNQSDGIIRQFQLQMQNTNGKLEGLLERLERLENKAESSGVTGAACAKCYAGIPGSDANFGPVIERQNRLEAKIKALATGNAFLSLPGSITTLRRNTKTTV